jgi:hypothetical protein
VRFADAFPADDGAPPVIRDRDFLLTCTCGLEQRLDTMRIEEEADLTLYECSRCENSIVGVMRDDAATDLWISANSMTRRQEVGGHRRGGFVIGSKVDVVLRPARAGVDVALIPATPNFFAALRYL